MAGLRKKGVLFVVNRYIGVKDGYLGDFSYRTHREFYPEYCDLDIDPDQLQGTTRERFIEILSNADARTQAMILEGVLARFPPGSSDLRTEDKVGRIRELIRECQGVPLVSSPNVRIEAEVVGRALADAEVLLREAGPTSALDRAHTALHGFLKAACRSVGIETEKNESATSLFKKLRTGHPALNNLGPHACATEKILRTLANMIDALNPARNRGSLAHPNDELVDDDAAMLFINSARTVLQYVQARISRHAGKRSETGGAVRGAKNRSSGGRDDT